MEDPDKQLFVVYRGDLDHYDPSAPPPPSDLPRPLSDRDLEEVVTRAILSARRQAESENALYRQVPPLEVKNSNLRGGNNGEDYRRHHQQAYNFEQMMQQRQLQLQYLRRLQAAREMEMQSQMASRDPYTVHGGVTNHWDTRDWQGLGNNDQEYGEMMDPEEATAVEIVGSDETDTSDAEDKDDVKEETQEKRQTPKEEMDPSVVEDMEEPPLQEEEVEITTPKP